MKVDGNLFRQKRFAKFLRVADLATPSTGKLRILDVGGTQSYWEALSPLWAGRDFEITIVNLGVEESDSYPYHVRAGDACALDQYESNSYDIVHSNSVIEHVGRWTQMQSMAGEIRRLAPHYYVQTPNYWFPYEPHYRTAFMHWYPESVRASMIVKKKRGFIHASSFDQAMRDVQDINLITARQMTALFPDAEIHKERVGPLTKSLIAIR
jgi:hypothetical protein